jgi:NAD(P)-dependent dehydrogenase (short-subunit alcohol dehydrogenase family)
MDGDSQSDPGFGGKVALVTGGGSGIGLATALAFNRVGARVAVSDVAVEAGEETVASIRARGGEAIFVRADVADPDQVAALFEVVVDTYGRLDCAFNNAGIEGPLAATGDYPLDAWERVIAVNLTGVWLCLKHELALMRRQGGGAIVNTASVSGMMGYPPLLPAYVAAKHGVVGLTRVAAREYASLGIRINAVSPGAIATPMLDRITIASPLGEPPVSGQAEATNPTGRRGSPAEVAAAVLWLCSEAASFVTGHALVVDGGFLA